MKTKSLLILSLTGLLFTGLFSCKKDSTTDPAPVIEKAPQTSALKQGFMFYNSSNGVATFGEVTNVGYKDIKAYNTLLGAGWTKVVPYKGQLYCYNASSGKSMMFDGVKVVKEYTDFAAGWSHIIPIEDKYLLFYNDKSGAAAWGKFDSNVFTQITSNTFSAGWTSIAASANQLFFFMGDAAATTAVGNFDGTKFTQTSTVKILTPGFKFYPFGLNKIAWYDARSSSGSDEGNVGLTEINNGKATYTSSFYNTALKGANVYSSSEDWMLFYSGNKMESCAISGNAKASLTTLQTSLSTGWTHIVPIKFN
jgi:hypothetical protein